MTIDPLNDSVETIYDLKTTPAGTLLRAQDQADFALRPDGLRAWFVASYRDRAEIVPVGPGLAMPFRRTPPACQRSKRQ